MISKQEVQQMAKLARLGLSNKETEKYRKDLSAILDYVNLLKKADISKVKAVFSTVLVGNVMREDEIKEQGKEVRDNLLEAIPKKENRYVKVKAVLK